MKINDTTTANGETLQDATVVTGPAEKSRKRNMKVFVLVSVVNVVLLGILGWQLLTPRAAPPGSSNTTNGQTLGSVSSPLIGKQAPDFELFSLTATDGTKVRLSDFKGKPVVLNFWASWCEPCKEEAALLQESWTNTLRPRGITLIGVDNGDTNERALNFVKKYNVTYTNVVDTFDGATGIAYGTTGKPETFFINKDGVVVSRWSGPLDAQGLQSELAKIQSKQG